jgi:maleate cis-trans isomerase
MWESEVPKRRIGTLSPLGMIENGAYEFYRLAPKGGMELAYELGRLALKENPDADGQLVFPVCRFLEKKFGIPCISNQDSCLWDCLTQVKFWKPIKGQTMLLRSR